MRNLWKLGAVASVLVLSSGCPGGGGDDSSSGGGACPVGKTMACMCPDGQARTIACPKTGRPPACPCFANPNMNSVNTVEMTGTGGALGAAGAAGAATGAGGAPMMSVPMGAAGMAAPMPGAGGAPAMTGAGGAPAMMGSGGTTAMTGTGGSSGMPTGTAEVEALRQVCVDTINMYRATVQVTPALAPLTRGTPADETCSDAGAKIDGDSMQAHKSAGMCMGYGGQDACPGWPVGGSMFGGGYATLQAALTDCLKKMWDEGAPPVSRSDCQMDYQNCFLKYGHYLNMSDPSYTGVVCGFYLMQDGMSWWMNQDFKSKPWGAP